MDITHELIIPCVCSFIACAAFGVQFNIRLRHLVIASSGALISQLISTLLAINGFSDMKCCFLAAAVAAAYSEIMAKLCKAPVNMYLIVGIIPLVPGSTAYYSMLALVMGDNDTFLDRSVDAFATAGAIAMGIFAVSSAVRLYKDYKRQIRRSLKRVYKNLTRKKDKSVKKI